MKRLVLVMMTAAVAGAQTFGLEQYAKIARVTDPHVSPNGSSAVLVLSRPNYVDDRWDSELIRVDLQNGHVRDLTHDRKSARHPRWSPSGDRLAFLADSAGQPQLFVMDVDGGEAQQITHAPTGVQAFAWKPDGKAFAYISPDEAPKREKYDDSFEVEANDYLFQSGTQPSHLWIVDSTGGAPRRLTSGHWSVSGTSLAWDPAGEQNRLCVSTFVRYTGFRPAFHSDHRGCRRAADAHRGTAATPLLPAFLFSGWALAGGDLPH